MPSRQFAKMPDDIEPTRASLHQYALAIGSIPRVHAEPHEKWWHVSLNLTGRGLETDSMPLPDGATFAVRLDMHSHAVVIEANGETVKAAMIHSKVNGKTMKVAVYQVEANGEQADEPWATLEFKRQKRQPPKKANNTSKTGQKTESIKVAEIEVELTR